MGSMLRPDQAQRDVEGRMSEGQAMALAREAMRVRYLPVMGDTGTPYTNSTYPVGIMEAIVTTAITPCGTGETWGTGAVRIYYYDDEVSNTSAQPDTSGDGPPDNAVGDTSTSQPVKNWYTTSGTIAVGKHCQVYFAAGGLRLLTWEC